MMTVQHIGPRPAVPVTGAALAWTTAPTFGAALLFEVAGPKRIADTTPAVGFKRANSGRNPLTGTTRSPLIPPERSSP
jgi:hypothetical protein